MSLVIKCDDITCRTSISCVYQTSALLLPVAATQPPTVIIGSRSNSHSMKNIIALHQTAMTHGQLVRSHTICTIHSPEVTSLKTSSTRRQFVQRIPLSCNNEIGTVLLQVSCRYVGLNLPMLHHNWFSPLHFHFSYRQTTGLYINTTKYPYLLDRFQN